ncbi:unnamed protein product [Heligmosomoides polygyrus]|uniref:C2 domain-containing protein n=1 Tax=Heligmosomoides polygyrus TaxID=6339 RepID=A0A183F516_HELPZ|nr:unnamed protein product [Heligmosomoides polygyrus]
MLTITAHFLTVTRVGKRRSPKHYGNSTGRRFTAISESNPKPNFRERFILVHSEAVFAKVGLDLCGPSRPPGAGTNTSSASFADSLANLLTYLSRFQTVMSDASADQRVTSPKGLSPQAMEHDFQSAVAGGDDAHDEAMDATSSHSDNQTDAPPSPDHT